MEEMAGLPFKVKQSFQVCCMLLLWEEAGRKALLKAEMLGVLMLS